MMATRDRKIAFIEDAGYGALERAVVSALRRNGADWLTDEQVSELASREVADARFRQHLNMRNRAATGANAPADGVAA